MKVVHTITKGDVGGAQTYVAELAAAQVGRGDEVIVIAGSGGPATARAERSGADVRIVSEITHAFNARGDRDAIRRLTEAYVGLSPDVVHGHSSKGGLVARLAARRAGVPSVYTAHGFPFQKGAPLSQRVMSFVGEFIGGHVGDVVICLTDEEADLARRSRVVRKDRVRVVPNGLPDTAHRRVPAVGRDDESSTLRVVMVARFAPPKQQIGVIEAFAALSDLDVMVTFVGDGPAMALAAEHASRAGVRAEFLGHRDDVDEILALSDVGLLWSGYEGMPISLLEAMRAELACVASDLPGVRRLFGHDGGVTAADQSELVEALRRLAVERSEVDSLARAGRRRFEAEFTIEAMVEATADAYADAISMNSSRGR